MHHIKHGRFLFNIFTQTDRDRIKVMMTMVMTILECDFHTQKECTNDPEHYVAIDRQLCLKQ